MIEYCRPEIKTYDASGLLERLGPTQTQYEATMNLYGGRTAQLSDNCIGEYRFVKADLDYGIVTTKEVENA